MGAYDYTDDFQVAYSTARADLSSLMNRGFLSTVTLEVKTIVYKPCPKFEQEVNARLS